LATGNKDTCVLEVQELFMSLYVCIETNSHLGLSVYDLSLSCNIFWGILLCHKIIWNGIYEEPTRCTFVSLMLSINYIVFDMLWVTKFSSSGRLYKLLYGILSCIYIRSLVAIMMCLTSKLLVQPSWWWTISCLKHVKENIIELKH